MLDAGVFFVAVVMKLIYLLNIVTAKSYMFCIMPHDALLFLGTPCTISML